MTLKDTIEMMNSRDYKERFKAEYLQVSIRINKLKEMVERYLANELTFTPSCSRELLVAQLSSMYTYMGILRERARIEGIEIHNLEGE